MRPGPQAAKEAGKKQLSLRPLTTRPECGGLPRVGFLSFPNRDPRPELAQGLAMEGGRWRQEVLSSLPKPHQMLEKQTIGETWRNKRPFDTISVDCVAGPYGKGLWEGVRNGDWRDLEWFRVL